MLHAGRTANDRVSNFWWRPAGSCPSGTVFSQQCLPGRRRRSVVHIDDHVDARRLAVHCIRSAVGTDHLSTVVAAPQEAHRCTPALLKFIQSGRVDPAPMIRFSIPRCDQVRYFDFASALPRHIDFKRRGLITRVLGMARMPRDLLENPARSAGRTPRRPMMQGTILPPPQSRVPSASVAPSR